MTTVSVVTGGAGGMGATCARTLAGAVDVVLLTDCDGSRLESAAEEIGRETSATVVTLTGERE